MCRGIKYVSNLGTFRMEISQNLTKNRFLKILIYLLVIPDLDRLVSVKLSFYSDNYTIT